MRLSASPRLQTIGVDIDETLCRGVCWTTQDIERSKPIPQMVSLVNRLYDDNFIVIYTARRDKLMSATFEWLKRHGIKFHAVSNIKIPLSYLLDSTLITKLK